MFLKIKRNLRNLSREIPKVICVTLLAGMTAFVLSRTVRIEVTTLNVQMPDTTINVRTVYCPTTESTKTTTSTTTIKRRKTTTKTTNKTIEVNSTKNPLIDYSKIINPHPFKYISLPVNVCKSTGTKFDPLLLVLVKSNVFQLGHRMAIRSTWGNFTNNNTVHIAYLLGYSPLITSFEKMEYNMYKDIIQEDFLDEYKNNTLKTIMGFNWAVKYCSNAKFVLFVDDDYYVNIPNILDLVKNITESENETTFIGYKYENARVRRKKDSKWYVSKEEYPDQQWPPYISGGSILLSMDVVMNMTKAFPHVKKVYIDDVYLGIVAKLLNISLTHDGRFEVKYIADKLNTLFTSHDFGSPNHLVQEWSDMEDKDD